MAKQNECEQLLDVHAVALRFGVTAQTVWSWEKAGRLRSIRVGRVVRFDPNDIQKFIETGKRK